MHPAWAYLVNLEHAAERALGLTGTPPDVTAGEGPPATVPGGASGTAPSGPTGSTVAARAGKPETAAAVRALGADVSRYWPELTGEPIQPQELELVLALSGLETTWGRGWTDRTDKGAGDGRNSNNFGARQDNKPGPSWRLFAYGDTRPPTPAEVAAGQVKNVPMPGVTFRYFIPGEGRSAAENGAYYFVKDLISVWNARRALRTGSARAFAHRLGPDRQNTLGGAEGGLGYYGGFGTTLEQREGGYANALGSRLPEVVAALGYERSHATVGAALGSYSNTASGDPNLAGVEAPGSPSPLLALPPIPDLPESPPRGAW